MPWLPSESQRVLQMTRSAHCTITIEPQKAPCEKWSASFCIMRLATFEYIWVLPSVFSSFAMNGYAKVGGTKAGAGAGFAKAWSTPPAAGAPPAAVKDTMPAVSFLNFVLAPSVPSVLAEQSVVREVKSEPKIFLPMRIPDCVMPTAPVRSAPTRSAATVEANLKLPAGMVVTPVVLQSVTPVKYDVPTRAPLNFSCTSPMVDSITLPSTSVVPAANVCKSAVAMSVAQSAGTPAWVSVVSVLSAAILRCAYTGLSNEVTVVTAVPVLVATVLPGVTKRV